MEELSVTIPDPSWEEEEIPSAQVQSSHKNFHSSQVRTPHQQRETSVEQSLDRVCKVHWKALSAAAALEEEIEKLHQMKSHFWSEVRPRSRDQQRLEGIQEERCCQASFTSEPTPSQSIDPDMPPSDMESEDGASNLGEPPELKVEVASFLEGSSEVSDGNSEEGSLEPSMLKFANWVWWKAGKCDTPDWWAELLTVPREDETRRLA